MYKSNDFKKSELLERLKGERSLLASTPNLSDDNLEELDRYDEVIQDLEYELNNWEFDIQVLKDEIIEVERELQEAYEG